MVLNKAVVVDANKDITGFNNVTATGTISTSGELDGGSLDISGNADIGGDLTFAGVTFQEYAQDKVSGLLNHSSHTNITASYDDASDKILLTGVPTYGDDDVAALTVGGIGVTETYTGDGNTLQFDTDPGLGLKHSGNTASDKIQLDYEVVSTAPSSVSGTEVGHLWFVV